MKAKRVELVGANRYQFLYHVPSNAEMRRNAMDNVLTIAMDETGTPYVLDEAFYTAGVHFRGDIAEIESKWRTWSTKNQFPVKGRKFNSDHLLAVSQFIVENSLTPFITCVNVDADLFRKINDRKREFESITHEKDLAEYKPRDMVWIHTALSSVASVLTQSLIHSGPVSDVNVFSDRFNLGDQQIVFLQRMFHRFFNESGVFNSFLNRFQNVDHPATALTSTCLNRFNAVDASISFEFAPRADVICIADAVATLMKYFVQNNPIANSASEILRLAFLSRTTIADDITEHLRKVAGMTAEQLWNMPRPT